MKKLSIMIAGVAGLLAASAAQAGTLEDVRAKGFVQCGVSQGVPGFSNPDDDGNWSGIDVDVCRAVAAAVFGDAQAVKFSPLTAKARFTALSSGEIDILSASAHNAGGGGNATSSSWRLQWRAAARCADAARSCLPCKI